MPRTLPPLLALALSLPFAAPAAAADLKLLLPLNRTAYQTNEWIAVSVVRSDAQDLPAATLALSLTAADGGRVAVTFPLPPAPALGGRAVQTGHYHVNARLLRPGRYKLEVTADGVRADADIALVSHLRKSDFRLINWGQAKGAQQLAQGEDGFGFNLFYGHYADDADANFIRAGVDFMANCVMGGGHQMDLRGECDWSDPFVIRGGTQRVVRRAFMDRTRPNVPGVHFYDEPGLTWEKNEATGEFTPHGIRAQVRSYEADFGRPPIPYQGVDPKDPEQAARWKHWALWKLGLMDAAWREAQFGVSQVRPDFLSVTQSQYGFSAFTDGYYFNVARSLPVVSGHGGYHDYGPGYFNPSFFLEMARARDFAKPCWYLPTWYGNTTADQFRLEQNLSFMTNIQGMVSPPGLEPATNANGREGIVETNHLYQRLGPVFTTMPVTRPPVAMLFSLSQMVHTQTLDRSKNYAGSMPHGVNLPLTYLAGKVIQQQFLAVLDEDVLDGTLAAHHKAVVLTSIDYLDPAVIAALERFAAGGGKVLLTGDCTVTIKGAVKLPVSPAMPDQKVIDELLKAKKNNELAPYQTTGKFLQGALPLAQAIKAELDQAGIKPVFECDLPTIVATRQAQGDIEYLFAVNATYDESSKDKNAIRTAEATIALPDDGRSVYDAVTGGPVPEFAAKGGKLTGKFRFGPGQMRVFARTARPIGGVSLGTPAVVTDLAAEDAPIRVDVTATLQNGMGGLVSGSAPLRVRLTDPLGQVRYELYRATKQGVLQLSLPLAVNDPPGNWMLEVRDLLADSSTRSPFAVALPAGTRSIAGAERRAVTAVNDRANVFRFARLFREVTIVKGTSPFNDTAAQRLTKILEPWGVRCKVVPLEEATKSRSLTEEEARTWVGLAAVGKGQIKPGSGNPPALVGFAVPGPVILLGNPDDNPIIKFLLAEKFLPYTPKADEFPGRGRGFVAWQRDGVGRGQESVTLIAYDEAGMNETVGTLYEAVAGIDPLTKYEWPTTDEITPAQKSLAPPAAEVVWTARLPDRVELIGEENGDVRVLTHDNSLAVLNQKGGVQSVVRLSEMDIGAVLRELDSMQMIKTGDMKISERPDRMMKIWALKNDRIAVAYWGGTLRITDRKGAVLTEQQMPQDVTALTWVNGQLLAGLADGRVLALKGK